MTGTSGTAFRPGSRARSGVAIARLQAAVEWLDRRRPRNAPVVLLVLAIVGWVAFFSLHVYWRQDRFGTADHDLGIWDQAVWLLSEGRSFITVRGLHVFGFHASPALYLYVPFYWLGAGPNFLDISQVLMLSLGAVAVFRVARHHLGNEWQSLVLAIAFLFNFTGQWVLHETFHPEVMAVTPLLFAYLAACEGRWRALAGWLVFALMWKEDVALAGLMIGFVLVVRGKRTASGQAGPEATRKVGGFVMGFCLLWFVIATQLVIPAFSDEGNFTEGLYGDLGSTPTEIARTAVVDPSRVSEQFQRSNPPRYILELTGSYGFVPLVSPLTLLVGLPQALINLLATYNFFWTTRVHYASIPFFATTLAAIEGVTRWRNLHVRRLLLGLVVVGTLFTGVKWGITPVSGPRYRSGVWPLTPAAQQAAFEDAVARPGPEEAVSTMYQLVPHLSHRREIYTFPNPWIDDNWGVRGENRPDPDQVDWIIVNPEALNDEAKGALVGALTAPGRLLFRGQQPVPTTGGDFGAIADPSAWQIVKNVPDLLIVRRIRR